MLRRIPLYACIMVVVAVCGCSTAADYQAAQSGQFQSQNLWLTDRESRAGEH